MKIRYKLCIPVPTAYSMHRETSKLNITRMQLRLWEDEAVGCQKSTTVLPHPLPPPRSCPCPLILIHCRHLSAEKIEGDREGHRDQL